MKFSLSERPARALRAGLLAFLLALFAAFAPLAQAQPGGLSDTETQLSQAREKLDAIRKALDSHRASDEDLVQWRTDVQQVQGKADALTETLTPRVADIAARLAQLGPVPTDTKEARDVAEQRAQLEKVNANIQSQMKLAKLLSVDAAQIGERLLAERRTLFQAQLGERHRTFFSHNFRSELARDLPNDLAHFNELGEELGNGMGQTPGGVWALLAVGLIAVLAARYGIRRLLLHIASTRVPSGRLRRSAFAAAQVAVATATPGLIAYLAHLGLNWSGTLSEATESLLSGLVGIICLAGYVGGLGHALMSPRRASWRLLPLPDEVALGLRRLPGTLATLAVIVWLTQQLPAVLDISLVTTMAMTSLAAVALGIAMAWGLSRGEHLRRKAQVDPETGHVVHRSFWVATLSTLAWLALIVGILGILIGYAALGTFIITQELWLLIVACSAYLLALLLDDGFMTLLAGKKPEHPTTQSRLRHQAAVLLSGAGRVVVVLVAIVLLLSPFGDGPAELLRSLDQFRRGLQIGEVRLQPAALIQALLVLVLGLLCVRVLKRWLKETYLPSTSMDPGMRSSTSTLFGYAGIVCVAALALSALGIGLDRVAWIASALSVGIGFGLQAVVQNFVSGLILLAERPVKVGDWVSLGGVEGDIQRINVRATEILMQDKSTVIVPNSEFITKTVRNVTHTRSMGRVQVKLPMPLNTDAARVRELIMASFAAQPEILEAPAATVYLDGIENDRLVFNALAYVESPRLAYVVRSRVLFDVLARMAQAGLEVSASSTVVLQGDENAAAPAPTRPQP